MFPTAVPSRSLLAGVAPTALPAHIQYTISVQLLLFLNWTLSTSFETGCHWLDAKLLPPCPVPVGAARGPTPETSKHLD